MFLLAPVAERGWTQQQAWTLIKSLAKDDALRYNELLLNAAFSGSAGEKAIAALEQSELVSVQSDNGRPCSIKAGKPVYTPAFRRLLDDKVLAAKMDLAMVGEATGKVSKAIDQHEVELKLLAELPKQPPEVFGRVSPSRSPDPFHAGRYLLTLLLDSLVTEQYSRWAGED